MIQHELKQGSDEWHQFRLEHFGASEAAAMLGLSKKVTRTQLLHMKHAGTAKEFSDWVQSNVLDYGHEVEALARPFIEELIGEELYPGVYSDGKISASCDGITMLQTHGWEHKQWNKSLAAAVAVGELPDEFMAQPQQCMMVTGAGCWKFTVSDGTKENMVSMDILPDPAWFERIRAGWAQFERDLADYVPTEVVPAAVAAPIKDLPAIIYKLNGLALTSNLSEYKAAALQMVEDSKSDLVTDQDFADRDALCKKFKKAEEGIALLQSQVIGEIKDVDAFCRNLEEIGGLIRQARLNGEKKVAAEKENRRNEIIAGAKAKWTAHTISLNTRLGKPYMPEIAVNFAGVMKGLKSMDSMNDAVDTELARAKIEANAIADKIEANLKSLRELAENHKFLFSDTPSIIAKENDDLIALIKSRIADHTAAEAKKAESLRAKMAEEERIKAEAKMRAGQEKANAEIEAERARLQAANDKMLADARPTPSATAEVLFPEPDAPLVREQLGLAPANPSAAIRPAPTLPLGKIGSRLGFSLTAEFLRSIGFEPAGRERAAMLYHEADWPLICVALVAHINRVKTQQRAA